MKTATLLHRLKPDGYKDAPIVTSMRHLINEMQEIADAAHAEIAAIHQPADLAKGAMLEDWKGHEPLQLEVTENDHGCFRLEDIRARGVSVSEWLQGNLWDEAEAWIRDNLDRETSDSESRVIDRMDANDLLHAQAA